MLREVLNAANASYKLVNLGVSDKENHLPAYLIKLGTEFKSTLWSKDVTEGEKHKFKKQCLSMLVKNVEKLQERCSLKYMVARNAASLSLVNMAREKKVAHTRFGSLCQKSHLADLIFTRAVEFAKDEFDDFTKSIVSIIREEFT